MDPESIMVKTAKRAPTMAAEEQSSPRKKPKVDEEEEMYIDTGIPELGSKPEWDKDSYDGRDYESDPDFRELFSEEEQYEKYREGMRKAFASKGFLSFPLSGIYPLKDLEKLGYGNITIRESMTNLANLCVKKLNETEGKTVELVDIVRVIVRGGATRKAYITFMAREFPDGPLVEYQAKAVKYVRDLKPPFPILCRPSPIPTI